MFGNLIESSPRRNSSSGQVLLSLAFHVAVGVGAVEASRRGFLPVIGPQEVPIPIYTPAAPPKADPRPETAVVSDGPAGPPDPIVIAPPTEVPIGIPPAEPGPAVDPRRFSLVPAGPRCPDCVASPDSTVGLFSEGAVDEPAQVVSQPAPVFPAVLKAAGVGGSVQAQFVVDTLGSVEPGSVSFDSSAHPAFEASARSAIEHSRFVPARIQARPVRQRVRQLIRFEIRP